MRLVLLPGLSCDRALWRHQLDQLADLAGIVVADLTRSDTVEGLARDVLAQAGAERFALAGLSMGGYVAFETWRQAPDRIDRLALLDTTPDADTPEVAATRRARMERTCTGGFDGVVDELVPLLLHPGRVEALGPEVAAMAHRVGPEAFLRQQAALLSRPDSRPLLSRITCPTLVLCGREDVLTPPELHTGMADAIPRARLVVVEGSGHLTPMERPVQVTTALRDWLRIES